MSGVDYAKGHPPVRPRAGRGIYGKYLAKRNPQGQFVSVLFCGRIRGVENIINENDRAVRQAIENGLIIAMSEMIPTAPKRTGKMRAVLQLMAQQVAAKESTVMGNRITIDVNQIKVLADGIEKYIKYHTTPPTYYPKGYKNPTTPGTKPVDMFELHKKAVINITQQVQLAHSLAGFDHR